MRKIDKLAGHPSKVELWITKNKAANWSEFPPDEKAILREQLKEEQKGLCCYCCLKLSNDNLHIEHLKSRQTHPKLEFDYDNLMLSCSSPKQCGQKKANKSLALHPLMTECDIEIKLDLNGELNAKTSRAEAAIDTLNLNNRRLNNRRKNLIDAISFTFDDTKRLTPPISVRKKEELSAILYAMCPHEKAELEYIVAKIS